MKDILRTANEGKIHVALKKMHKLFEDGHSSFDISNGFYKILSEMEGEIKREKIYEMMKCVSELRARVVDGLATELQLGGFLAKCAKLSY